MKNNSDFFSQANTENTLKSFLSNDGVWLRFSDYIINHDLENEFPVIVPNIDSGGLKQELYSPFDHYPTILLDFLKLLKDVTPLIKSSTLIDQNFHDTPFPAFTGPIITAFKEPYFPEPKDSNILNEIAKKVLPFNKKYGLLGLYDHYLYSTKLTHNQDHTDEDDKIDYTVRFKPQYGAYGGEISYDIYIDEHMTEFYGDLKKLYTKDKYLHIGDPIFTLMFELYNFIKIIELVENFKKGGFSLNDYYPIPFSLNGKSYKNTWGNLLNTVSVSNIQLGVNFSNNKRSIRWSFSSLLELMRIMYIYDLAIGENTIETCEFCGDPFIMNSPHQICCHQSCNTALRQRRHREKKKRCVSLFKEGYSIVEIANKLESSVSTIENWVKGG